MSSFADKVMESGKAINSLMVIGFLGIIWLIIYGNLSGNVGFAAGTAGFNNTEGVIENLTSGIGTFYGFAPTWFIILAIVLLIVILVGLLGIVLKIAQSSKNGGFSE